jgi:hypothetical protein
MSALPVKSQSPTEMLLILETAPQSFTSQPIHNNIHLVIIAKLCQFVPVCILLNLHKPPYEVGTVVISICHMKKETLRKLNYLPKVPLWD